MQVTTVLARGGTGGSPTLLASRDCALLSSTSAAKKSNAASAPSRQRRVLLNAASGSFLQSASARRRSPVSTKALKSLGAQELGAGEPQQQRQQRRKRLASHHQQQRLASPFALAAASFLSTAPAALRASDSDDPSDEDGEAEDDPALELTAEELAMAFSEDIKPKEEEEEEEEDEEVEEFDVAVATSTAAAAAKPDNANDDDADDADDARALALELARVAADTKASDVVVLHVAPLVYWTSYMVLCTVFSRPQLGAVLAKSEQAAAGERFGRDLGGARGAGRSPWEVLDFGDVVMHCFTPDQREFYDLEGFYGAAEEVELPAAVSGAAAAAAAGGRAGKRDASSWANRA